MNENGHFIDLSGRLFKVSTDFTHVAGKGSADQFGVGLSGEFGWRFDCQNSFFVEPSVVVAYNYLNSDDFPVGDVRYDLENSHSLTSRFGVASGFKFPENRGEVYARIPLANEFLGDVDVKASKATVSRAYTRDGQDTWFEYAFGTNVNVNANTYVYADVERTAVLRLMKTGVPIQA